MLKIIALSTFIFFSAIPKADARYITEGEATEIAKKIWRIMGFSNEESIKVQYDSEDRIASYDQRSRKITIAPKVIEMLDKKFGLYSGDALAIIIAHELRHKEQGMSGLGFAAETNANEKEIEKDADFQGLLAAHLAGYDVMKHYDKLIEHLDIASNIKEERKKNNDKISEQLEKVCHDYDLACYYTLCGELDYLNQAKAKFEAIEGSINNLGKDNNFIIRPLKYQQGLVEFLLAIKLTNIKYIFPLENMSNNFLRGENKNQADNETALKGLKKAEDYFDQVPDTESFFEIKLGKVCIGVAKEMLEKQNASKTDKQLNMLLVKTDEKQKQQHDLLKAILWDFRTDKEKAKNLFLTLEKSINSDIKDYAKANLKVINDEAFVNESNSFFSN